MLTANKVRETSRESQKPTRKTKNNYNMYTNNNINKTGNSKLIIIILNIIFVHFLTNICTIIKG